MWITVTKSKLNWCHGYLLVQNADCRLDSKCRQGTKDQNHFLQVSKTYTKLKFEHLSNQRTKTTLWLMRDRYPNAAIWLVRATLKTGPDSPYAGNPLGLFLLEDPLDKDKVTCAHIDFDKKDTSCYSKVNLAHHKKPPLRSTSLLHVEDHDHLSKTAIKYYKYKIEVTHDRCTHQLVESCRQFVQEDEMSKTCAKRFVWKVFSAKWPVTLRGYQKDSHIWQMFMKLTMESLPLQNLQLCLKG